MVAMPYILVGMVLDVLSLILFCISSAALLSKYPPASRYLPAKLRGHKILVVGAHALVLLALAMLALRVMARDKNAYMHARRMFELLSYVGIANSVVLAYQFLGGRLLRNTPKVLRRSLIAIFAVALTSAGVVAVVTAVVLLFTIR